MPEITATEASRSFAVLLDAVEHRGETFVIVRRGKVIAQLEPARVASGSRAKDVLRRHRIDPAWSEEVAELRSQRSPQQSTVSELSSQRGDES